METQSFRAMNTDVLLAAEGPFARIGEGFGLAQEFIQQSERRFSRFLEDSELCQLNRSAGEWFPASSDLYAVVALAQSAFHRTRGLFDPSILPDLERAGYDRSMDLVRSQGAAPLLETLLAGERPSFSEVEMDMVGQRILLPPTMSIDLGGIAKGWIAEQAALRLSGFSTACAVNAGGDMFLVGLPEGASAWPVGLEDPLNPDASAGTLEVLPGGLATSTITKRTWKQGTIRRHHLIDPRTGEPAVTDWLSVTVITAHAYEAEVLAKALLISGSKESEDIARNSGLRFSYLGIDEQGQFWGTSDHLEKTHVH
jgi:thiamine biosynthesis lipoprotein